MPLKAIMSTLESFVVTYSAPILDAVFDSDVETLHDACTRMLYVCVMAL